MARKRDAGREPARHARCGAQRAPPARVRGALASLAALLAAGCASATGPAARFADAHGFAVRTVAGAPFRHVVMQRRTAGAPGDPLWVFIEGDGRPFVAGGTRVAADPTPHRALALELAAQTPGAVLYLGRPCYFGLAADPGCGPALWTDARYSEAVVASLAAVIRGALAEGGHADAVLVGYSGGGALATLLGARLAGVRAVVTVAANLDVGAWAEFHRYRPLAGSLDPARLAPPAAPARLAHLTGGRDAVVPRALIAGYLAAHAGEIVGDFPDFDHACCWAQAWPAILADLAPWLDGRAPLPQPAPGAPQRAFSVAIARPSGG